MATLTLLLLPAGYVGTTAVNGNAALQALIADPMSLFAARSPGARSAGAFYQTKTAYSHSETQPADFLGMIPEQGFPSDDVVFSSMAQIAVEPGFDIPRPDFLIPFFKLPGSNGGSELSFVAGVFGGNESNDLLSAASGFGQDLTGLPPAMPIPEPQLWLMMLIGFLAIGSALRSQSNRKVGTRGDKSGVSPTCRSH